ncbi:MAG: aminopeptidase [Desulfuromonadales bacterium]|nr:aminopeptidase [Desulfuromonadales bacterium]MBN2792459.1 aminopeptidase [Desulfuromonadales bacterium]
MTKFLLIKSGISRQKRLVPGILFLTMLVLSGCSDLGYYLHCAKGHMKVLSKTRSISSVIEDPQTNSKTRDSLKKVKRMREFAVTELGLPDNHSYRQYADIERRYVVWNVVATKEFSLIPEEWCFPFAGCVSYKGFFVEEKAQDLARTLRRANYDVDVYGVEAYSTLNWFPDPVLNTFVVSSEARLAGLLFHELAHQLIYVADDTPFNEAFAMTVQIEGVRRWFQQHSETEAWQQYLLQRSQADHFQEFLLGTRTQLAQLYQQKLSEQDMRRAKLELFKAARNHFEELKRSGVLGPGFDHWMAPGLNNARLAGIVTYRELLPAFQTLLKSCEGNLPLFYQRVRYLADQTKTTRRALLEQKDLKKSACLDETASHL